MQYLFCFKKKCVSLQGVSDGLAHKKLIDKTEDESEDDDG